MTYAPADLLTVRQYVLTSTGLAGDAVGIVGDPDHAATGGYHEGNDDLARVGRLDTDYSKRESPRDRPGTNAASALDIGAWPGRVGTAGISWLEFNRALAGAVRTGDPRARDVREVIYTPDGSSVLRVDRLGLRATGDSGHLLHTHISFFRDSEGRRADADNLLGLLAGLIEGDDVGIYAQFDRDRLVATLESVQRLEKAAAAEVARDAATKAAIDALAAALSAAGGGSIDTTVVLARIDAVAAQESATVAALRAQVASLRAHLGDADPDVPNQ